MGRAGPRRERKYSTSFKLTAVRVSLQPGTQVQTVAAGLDIHPFMLSRWCKESRDGGLRGRLPRKSAPGPPQVPPYQPPRLVVGSFRCREVGNFNSRLTRRARCSTKPAPFAS